MIRKKLLKLGLWVVLPVLALFPGKRAMALGDPGQALNLSGSQNAGDPATLYLEHAQDIHGGEASIQYAGHRSHSSHRSHASHASHYSGVSSGGTSPRPTYPSRTFTPEPQTERLTPSVKPATPNDSGFNASPSHEEILKMGRAASQAGRYDEAIGLYKKVITANPASFTAHNNLGVTQFKQGNIASAKESFRHAINLNRDYPEAHYNLAVVLQGEGKQEEANAEYAKACALGISDACKMIGK